MNYVEVNLGKGVSNARKNLTEEIVRLCIGELLPKVRTLDITIDLLDEVDGGIDGAQWYGCLLYTSPSPRDLKLSRMPSSA